MRIARALVSLTALLAAAPIAVAQQSVLQGGPWKPGHIPQYVQTGTQPTVQDGGDAGGGGLGVNPSELGLVARSPNGVYPAAGAGGGPFGANFCDYDAPTDNPTGYHYFCISPNAQGSALIAVGAVGSALPLGLKIVANGGVLDFSNFLTTGGDNTWTGLNTFTKTVTFSGPIVSTGPVTTSGAVTNTGPVTNTGSVTNSGSVTNTGPVTFSGPLTYTGTGAPNSSTAQDRATFKGRSFDARADFGFACDGVTDDSDELTAMIAAINASPYLSARVTFPGSGAATCLIKWQNYPTLTKSTIFEGINSGGLRIASGQVANGNLLVFGGSAYMALRNFTLDLNSATPTASVPNAVVMATIGRAEVENSLFTNGAAPTAGTGMIELGLYGPASCRVTNNRFRFNAASNYQNQAINMGYQGGGEVYHCLVADNISIFSGIGAFFGDYWIFRNNEIQGVGFGAGISGGSALDNAPKHVLYQGNLIHDTLTTRDDNNFAMAGIENWLQGADIIGNDIRNTCGASLIIGAKANVLSNRMEDPWSCAPGGLTNAAAVFLEPALSSDPSGSVVTGNTAATNNGNMAYGYSDLVGTHDVIVGGNKFQGSMGAYQIAGATNFISPVQENYITNPCGQFDQRLEGAGTTADGAFAVDQWQLAASAARVQFGRAATDMGRCKNSIRMTVLTSTATPITTDYDAIYENLPLGDIAALSWGTAYQKNAVLGFCAKTSFANSSSSPWVGSAVLSNKQGVYSYVVNYKMSVGANALQCFSFVVPPPPNGFVAGDLTTPAASVAFDAGSGATLKTATTNAWVSGTFVGSTTASNFVSQANGATLDISDVRLLSGSEDEGWLQRDYEDEFRRARRFFRKSFRQGVAPAQNAGADGQVCASVPIANSRPAVTIAGGDPMMLIPTVTTYNPSAANSSWRDITTSLDYTAFAPLNGVNRNAVTIQVTATVPGMGELLCIHYTAEGGL